MSESSFQSNRMIAEVRKRVQTTLSRLTSSTLLCSESFLLEGDEFSGIRFSLGEYQAVWKIGTSEFLVYENGQEIQRVPIDPSSVRRAA